MLNRLHLLNRDPVLIVLMCSLWAAVCAASLLGTTDIFRLGGSSYTTVRELGMPAKAWGAGMLVDACALFYAVLTPRQAVRAFVSIMSGMAWVYFGAHVVQGGYRTGLVSIVGVWDLVIGVSLFATTVQWVPSNAV